MRTGPRQNHLQSGGYTERGPLSEEPRAKLALTCFTHTHTIKRPFCFIIQSSPLKMLCVTLVDWLVCYHYARAPGQISMIFGGKLSRNFTHCKSTTIKKQYTLNENFSYCNSFIHFFYCLSHKRSLGAGVYFSILG